MRRTVFYSWQSDLPAAGNRNLIQDCLKRAIRSIGRDEDAKVEPVLDRDTANLAGSADITGSILAKIAMANVFVADVSIINAGAVRPTSNPNVLVELGYAIAELGWDNVILVQNKVFGGPELLPFDRRGRRTVVYEAGEGTDRAEARGLLQGRLEAGLRAALDVGAAGNLPSGREANLWWGKWRFSAAPAAGELCLFVRWVQAASSSILKFFTGQIRASLRRMPASSPTILPTAAYLTDAQSRKENWSFAVV